MLNDSQISIDINLHFSVFAVQYVVCMVDQQSKFHNTLGDGLLGPWSRDPKVCPVRSIIWTQLVCTCQDNPREDSLGKDKPGSAGANQHLLLLGQDVHAPLLLRLPAPFQLDPDKDNILPGACS